MSKQSPEKWHGGVEFDNPTVFETPSATVIFKDDGTVGTTSVKRGDEKTIFTIGKKYGPRNIDPATDEGVAMLAKVTPYEFCAEAMDVASRFAMAPSATLQERAAVEADFERITAAAFTRVNEGEFTAAEAATVWYAFYNRNHTFRGIPYGGTESVADMPQAPNVTTNMARVALMA